MRKIELSKITDTIEKLCIDANYHIDKTFLGKLKEAYKNEESEVGKSILDQIIRNDEIADTKNVPMCQDTGVAVVFVEMGSEVVIEGDMYEAINEGVRRGYKNGYLRKSLVKHPLDRVNTGDNTPAIVNVKIVPGDAFNLIVAPKGGGSENMSVVKMLIPSDGVEGIKKLVLNTVFYAGGKPCPPLVLGIGIGGNFEKCALMAKEALMREIDDVNPDPILEKLEKEILDEVNRIGVGPMGFGGTTTAIGVKINAYPCHIASLPVAINLQCHASRHKSAKL